jgi:hypothetical protein
MGPGQLLKLLRPLYGLADSGDYCGRTLSNHLRKDLGMESTTGDPALFFKTIGNKLSGLCATYVDDTLQAGDQTFVKLSEQRQGRFQCQPREWNNVQFAGVEIETGEPEIIVHQQRYISKLMPLCKQATFKQFRSLRAKLSWITQTRPDVSCAVALAAQVTEGRYHGDPLVYINQLNRVIKHLKKVPDLPLRFPILDLSTLRLQVYSDASYANNADGSSQLGYIIFLADGNGACQPMFWSSHKSRRVTRSVLGSETMALADAFDMAHALKHDMEMIIKQKVPIVILTDSLSLFDVITRASITAEKRLMIDLCVVKQAYERSEVGTIGFVRTEHNPADVLAKIARCAILERIIITANLHHPVEQWIERSA